MKRAVFYARVSSDAQQKERTIESQISELKRQIRASGDVLVKKYIDDGFSGCLLDRPAMNDLRRDIRTLGFQTIYILNADRIARDVTYQNIIISEFLHYKKQIIINGKDYVNNPENKFTLTVLGAVSELERAKTLERTRRGSQHRLKQGYLLSNGCHIYGYIYTPRTTDSSPSYAINEHEAKIVRYIFETYAKGNIGLKELARQLKTKGLAKEQRNKLGDGHLKYILQNETYTGTKYFNTMTDTNAVGNVIRRTKRGKKIHRDRSEWVGIKIPQIVPKKLFDQVQARMKYNYECFRNAQRTQLLSNLVFCGKCKLRCFAYRRYYKVERKSGIKLYQKAVYRCRTKGINHNPEIDTRVLDSTVVEMVTSILLKPNELRNYISLGNNQKNQSKLDKQIKDVESKIKTVSKQKERIIDLYSFGDLEREEYVKRISIYDEEVGNLQTKRAELLKYLPLFQKPEVIKASTEQYCKTLKSQFTRCGDFNSKRQFLLDYIAKVEYRKNGKSDDKIKLIGAIAIEVSKDETVPIEFKIEQVINRIEALNRVKQLNTDDQTINGKEIPKKEYGKLVIEKL
ncbi:MAG: recombinase family protein [Candidatus Doudnabacteria bacterium]|nr:recombinase family protein [Candidatus Doudnabacteria bacterium]